jgi:hypothetical protein
MVDKLNYINVGDAGTFRKTGDYHSTPADVDSLIEHLRDKPKLVVHFHGGLVKESSGMEVADKLSRAYQGAHPVSIVWETGLKETVSDRVTSIHKTKLFKKLLKWVIKSAAKRIANVDSRGPAPLSDSDIDAQLGRARPFEDIDMRMAGARGGDQPITESNLAALEEEILAELEEDVDPFDPEMISLLDSPAGDRLLEGETLDEAEARGVFSLKFLRAVAQIAVSVLRRYLKGIDHGFYPTVVEEILQKYYLADIGEWVWGGMKLSAEEMWQDNSGRSGVDLHAGTYFAEKLAALQADTGLIVDMVGHSAGSIAICRMFKSLREQGVQLAVRNVIFMAPAVRLDLFVDEIVDKSGQYGSFRMYTMSDDFESDDSLVPYVYTRSLLYFISGVLEGKDDVPIAGMERYQSGEKPYTSAEFEKLRSFLADKLVLANSLELDPDAQPPYTTSAVTHGGFDDDQPTIDSVNALLALA